MKKTTALLFLLLVGATFMVSCNASKSRGCPTTNPRYFRP